MKKFIISIVAFFVAVAAIDWGFGQIMQVAESRSNSSNYHCMYEASEDVLILGSSLAARNFVPEVIEDSLHITCFNAGQPGVGVLCAWVRLNMFLNNHTPKIVLYTLTPGYDYLDTDDYSRYLGSIKDYFGTVDAVTQIYDEFSTNSEQVKLHSSLYKYNSIWISTIGYSLSHKHDYKGYQPLYTSLDAADSNQMDNKNENNKDNYKIDSLKLSYVDKTFALLSERNIRTICIITPRYGRKTIDGSYNAGIGICKKYSIPLINDLYDEKLSLDASMFYDKGHLNDRGARIYSKKICNDILDCLNNKK